MFIQAVVMNEMSDMANENCVKNIINWVTYLAQLPSAAWAILSYDVIFSEIPTSTSLSAAIIYTDALTIMTPAEKAQPPFLNDLGSTSIMRAQ